MNNKSKLIIVLLLTSVIISSCGPKRYKCGPYKRCEVNFEKNPTTKNATILLTTLNKTV